MELTNAQRWDMIYEKCVKIGKIVLLFFFVFDVALRGISTKLSSRKFALLGFSLIFFYKYFIKKERKKVFESRMIRNIYILEIVITAFSAVHVYIRADINGVLRELGRAYPYPVYFMIFALLAPIIFYCCFRTEREFLECMGGIGVLQSIFIWCEYSFDPLKAWLVQNIYITGVQYTERKRATGLGMSGAALTVMLAFCVFALGMLILEQEKNFKYWLQTGIIISAQIPCGRTGLYISILNIGLIFLLVIVRKKPFLKNLFYAAGSGVIILLAVTAWLKISAVPTEIVDETVRRTTLSRALTKEEGGFYRNFTDMEVETAEGDMIWGMGIYSGKTQRGGKIRSDSGYFKRVWGDGIVFAAAEYAVLAICFLLLLFGQIKEWWKKFYYFWMVAALYVIEIKEPFIYYYLFVTVILTIFFLNRAKELEGQK